MLTILAALLALAGAAVSVPPRATAPPPTARVIVAPPLRVVHFDVGQGDAALVITPEGRHVLIDGGPEPDSVAALLSGMGVDTLDLVVASHNHADHIDGLPAVFVAFAVRAYIENGIPATTALYRRLLDRIEEEPGLRVLRPTDRAITLGSLTLHVLPPPGVDRSQNDNSVGIEIEYGQFRELLTGDAERPELGRWMAEGRAHTVTVIKVGHHGSSNATTAAWVRATRPAVAVISVGAHNKYHHPSASVERMWKSTATVYRTDRDGTIEISATPDGRFSVRTHAPVTAAGAAPASKE